MEARLPRSIDSNSPTKMVILSEQKREHELTLKNIESKTPMNNHLVFSLILITILFLVPAKNRSSEVYALI